MVILDQWHQEKYMGVEDFNSLNQSQVQEGWMHFADGSAARCKAIGKDDGKFIVLVHGDVQEGERRRIGGRTISDEWVPTGYPVRKE